MKTVKHKFDFDATIRYNDGEKLPEDIKASIKERAREIHNKRSAERITKSKLLGILYQMEDYLSNNTISAEQILPIGHFLKLLCETINLPKTKFADLIETDVSNLNKYLNGQRRFSVLMAKRIAYFFHIPVDLLLSLEFKNTIILLKQNENSEEDLKKYDYEKYLVEQ